MGFNSGFKGLNDCGCRNITGDSERLLSWRQRFGINEWEFSWRAEYALSAVDDGPVICDVLCSFRLSILLSARRKEQSLNYSPSSLWSVLPYCLSIGQCWRQISLSSVTPYLKMT